MIDKIILFAVQRRYIVVFITLLIVLLGAVNLSRLPIDAVPDVTNKQVQVNSVAPSLSPVEIEKRVTYPLETALAGIPGLQTTRSLSRNGFSQITAVFSDDVDIYFARQQVSERLASATASLPAGVDPRMGPISTGLGEIVMWTIEYQHHTGQQVSRRLGWQQDGSFVTPEGERLRDPVALGSYLRTVEDWLVRPQVRNVPGLADVDVIGGYEKQYVVEPRPTALASYGISFTELARALEATNLAVSGNLVQRGGEAFLVRADARVRNINDIASAVVAERQGVPITVDNLADVRIGGALRTGSASENGHEVVIGTAMMRIGENSRTVAKAVVEKLDQVRKTLPPGVTLRVVYDRSKLVDATIHTVSKNLAEGALLVVVVLLLLLGNFRAAIIAALVIPVSLLMTAIGMNELGVSGNLMSLGALDFGLIVDGAVIIVENSLRRLAERQHRQGGTLSRADRLQEVAAASHEMIRPSLYGQGIILLVYVPLLTFQGVEGKMFLPMAITVMLALAAAFVLSVTTVPALIAILMNGKISEKDVRIIEIAKERYAPALRKVIARPRPIIVAGTALFLLAAVTFMFVGQEFIPQLDEQDVLINPLRIPSTSIDQSQKMQMEVERAVEKVPEVQFVFSRTGTAEVASDPMPPNLSDTFVIAKPRDQWGDPGMPKAELVEKIDQSLKGLLGQNYQYTQPIQMRFNELVAGVRADVAVSVYGDNLGSMLATAQQISRVLKTVPGTRDLRVEQTQGFPTLDVALDRNAIARRGLTVEEVAATLETAMGGREAGTVFEGDQRYAVVVRLPDSIRNSAPQVGALPVMLPPPQTGPRLSVPFRDVASLRYSQGLNQISRQDGKRRIMVQLNVRGRDLGSFVQEAQDRVSRAVTVPPGSWLEWGGQYQNLQAAKSRLLLVVPLVFAVILGLLYLGLGGLVPAIAVFSAIPLAIAGGVFALALRGIPFSISAAVGFIALSGVAVLNGLVMMSSIRRRLDEGIPPDEAIAGGALERFRPVLSTALVASLGFVPMALATGTGAEVQKPLATVVIGGLITATVLTLFVLPAISKLIYTRQRRIAGNRPAINR
ncbi:MAG: CusA/CzcA family heavy metal efflux RND transporter [Pseudomonadota bacterium]